MKVVTVLVATFFAVSAGAPSFAQGRGNGQAKKTAVSTPKAKPAAQSPKHTTQSPKNTTKTAAKVEARAVKADTRAARADAKAASKNNKLTIVTTDVTPTTPTGNAVKNPKLEQRLLTLLPPGSTIQDASNGFKNWGQFVAAAHVSNNLGIPFADLKSRMTGIPIGSTVPTMAPMSLGQAIQSFKSAPTTGTGDWSSSRTRREVKKAEDAANADLRRTRDRS